MLHFSEFLSGDFMSGVLMVGDFMSYLAQIGDFLSGDFMSGDVLTGYHGNDIVNAMALDTFSQ